MTEDLPHLRCYTCGKVLADKFNHYRELVDSGMSIDKALDAIGLSRYCCRVRMLAPIKVLSTAERQTDPDEPAKALSAKTDRLSVALDREAPSQATLSSLRDTTGVLIQPQEESGIKLPSIAPLPAAGSKKKKAIRVIKAR